MKKTRSYILASVVFAIAAFTSGYLYMRTHAKHKPAGPPERVTIAHSTLPNAALAQIAQVQGYYLHEGLDVVPQLYPYGKPALQAVIDGRADFATVAETPIMFAIMNGAKIAIIATIETSNKSHAIVARKDRGIITPEDFKGKTIAATKGTTGEYFMDSFLAVHGIAREDMNVVDMKPEAMQTALLNGEVDAASTWDPFLITAQKELGDRGNTFYAEEIYTETFNVVAKDDFIRSNPGKVTKILRALMEAEDFCRRQPKEAQRIVADFSHMDEAMLREKWQDSDFNVRLDQSLLLALEDETQWAVRERLVTTNQLPDYLDHIYVTGLESISPEAVRILR